LLLEAYLPKIIFEEGKIQGEINQGGYHLGKVLRIESPDIRRLGLANEIAFYYSEEDPMIVLSKREFLAFWGRPIGSVSVISDL
jgi:hypothetical protein